MLLHISSVIHMHAMEHRACQLTCISACVRSRKLSLLQRAGSLAHQSRQICVYKCSKLSEYSDLHHHIGAAPLCIKNFSIQRRESVWVFSSRLKSSLTLFRHTSQIIQKPYNSENKKLERSLKFSVCCQGQTTYTQIPLISKCSPNNFFTEAYLFIL